MLIPAERRNAIYEILRSQGIVRVSTLSDKLNVSEITIRRDLELMEAEGLLERTHGGAVFNQHIHLEPRYSEKHRTHQTEKRLIGAAAANLVEDGDSLLINSGSTTLQIFRHLVGRHNLKIITSNMGAFLEIQGLDLDLIFVGGAYRPQSNSLVGELAILSLQQVYASKCFIGVDGISLKYGVTTPNVQEATIARNMIERTRGLVVVVADHSKFGVVADFVTAPLEKVHVLVTDAGIHSEHIQSLQERGIRVVIAEAP
jgi:DeoR family fructose operon transcriptional repressor